MSLVALVLLTLFLIALLTVVLRAVTHGPWGLSASAGLAIALAAIGVLLPLTLFTGLPFGVFLLLLALVAVAVFFRARARKASIGPFALHRRTPDAVDVMISFAILSFTYLFVKASHRWGEWDAWGQWSMHARFLASDAAWTALFTMDFAHPEYPLMQPAILGAFWRASGVIDALSPMFFSLFVGLGIIGAVHAALRELVPRLFAAVAFLLLCVDAEFMNQVGSQYADSLLALFMLLAVIFLCRSERPSRTEVGLIGFFSGCAAWTKNEGIVFFVVMALITAWVLRGRWRDGLGFAFCSAPFAIMVVWFKLAYAPPSDLAGAGDGSLLSKLLSIDRHLEILSTGGKAMYQEVTLFLPLLIVILVLWRRGPHLRGALVVLLMCAAYYLTYLITPLDLTWHLSRSVDRLLHQMLPILLFAAFHSAGTPGSLFRPLAGQPAR